MIVLGIDPGARGTGLAVIDATTRRVDGMGGTHPLLASCTVRRPDEPILHVSPAHLREVIDAARAYVTEHGVDLIAVEGIVRPNPHAGITDPSPILAAAMVFGAVFAHGFGPPKVIVRPGGHGSKPLGWYPDALVSPSERRGSWHIRAAGSGRLKDQRSAYDVAVAGHALRAHAHTATPYSY